MAWSKMLWATGAPSVIGSWDFWTSVSGAIIRQDINFYKSNNKIAFYCTFYVDGVPYAPGGTLFQGFLMSPDSNAVKTAGGYGPDGSIVDTKNALTWYYTNMALHSSQSLPEDSDTIACLISGTHYHSAVSYSSNIAQDLLDRIYTLPLQHDYVDNNTYKVYKANIRKSIRKAYGSVLFLCLRHYDSDYTEREKVRYTYFSDNADTIINYMVSQMRSDDIFTNFNFYLSGISGSTREIISFIHYSNAYNSDYYAEVRNGGIWWGGYPSYLVRISRDRDGYYDIGSWWGTVIRDYLTITQDNVAPYTVQVTWNRDTSTDAGRVYSTIGLRHLGSDVYPIYEMTNIGIDL